MAWETQFSECVDSIKLRVIGRFRLRITTKFKGHYDRVTVQICIIEPFDSNATDIAVTAPKIDLEIGFHIPHYIELRLNNEKSIVGTTQSTIFIVSIVWNNPLIPIRQPAKTDQSLGREVDLHLDWER